MCFFFVTVVYLGQQSQCLHFKGKIEGLRTGATLPVPRHGFLELVIIADGLTAFPSFSSGAYGVFTLR